MTVTWGLCGGCLPCYLWHQACAFWMLIMSGKGYNSINMKDSCQEGKAHNTV